MYITEETIINLYKKTESLGFSDSWDIVAIVVNTLCSDMPDLVIKEKYHLIYQVWDICQKYIDSTYKQ